MDPLDPGVLPDGIRGRFLSDINGLRVHVLEAGDAGRPGLLLLHGFPELAYSWRHVMVPLAEAGFHVFAPDLRGYGRTTGADTDYDGDLASYRRFNIVRDVLGVVAAMHCRTVAVVGHDFGSPIAAWCAVLRPDVFTAVALMSAPFPGPPRLPEPSAGEREGEPLVEKTEHRAHAGTSLFDDLAALERPRKHYQQYYQTREANPNMWRAPQGVHAFLRGYYHVKSADWPHNRPFRLGGRTAAEMARMPTYYVMDAADGMAETVAKHMPSDQAVATNAWLPDAELAVYAAEYERTGFQGGLNHYRSGGIGMQEQQMFAGRGIEQPSTFISGAADWGVYQSPGALEHMRDEVCTDFRGVHLLEGAGHWVQQEQPTETVRLLVDFLRAAGRS